MAYNISTYVEYLSLGLVRVGSVSISPTSPTSAGLLTFYSIESAGDGNPLQTVLYSDVAGDLELSSSRTNENDQYGHPVETFLFIPRKKLTGVSFGVRALSSTDSFIVQAVETYDDHQEIVLRKVNT